MASKNSKKHEELGKRPNGQWFKMDKYFTMRSAFKNLLKNFRVLNLFINELTRGLNEAYEGLKRTIASLMSQGQISAKDGKDALPFSLFQLLARKMLCSNDVRHIFGHSYFLLSWNQICIC